MTAKNTDTQRNCRKCHALFTFTPSNTRGWQCHNCRNAVKNGKRTRQHYVKRSDRPWAATNAAHTREWHERNLGANEAALLTQLWRVK